MGDVRPLPARKGRVAPLSRAARASGDGSVAQRGWRIATKPVASLAKASADVGRGSAAVVVYVEVGRLFCVRGTECLNDCR